MRKPRNKARQVHPMPPALFEGLAEIADSGGFGHLVYADATGTDVTVPVRAWRNGSLVDFELFPRR